MTTTEQKQAMRRVLLSQRGAMKDVASSLHLTPQSVSCWLSGRTISKRIEVAVRRKVDSILAHRDGEVTALVVSAAAPTVNCSRVE